MADSVMLPREKVYISPLNIRKYPGDTTSLEDSINRVGLLSPLVVKPDDKGAWEVIVGSRRLRSLFKLGWPEIPCIIWDDLTDVDAIALSVSENIERNNLEEDELKDALCRLKDAGLSQSEIARRLNRSLNNIVNLFQAWGLEDRTGLKVAIGKRGPQTRDESAPIPSRHAAEVAEAVGHAVKKGTVPEERRVEVERELATGVKPLEQEGMEEAVKYFRRHPTAPIQEAVEAGRAFQETVEAAREEAKEWPEAATEPTPELGEPIPREEVRDIPGELLALTKKANNLCWDLNPRRFTEKYPDLAWSPFANEFYGCLCTLVKYSLGVIRYLQARSPEEREDIRQLLTKLQDADEGIIEGEVINHSSSGKQL